MINELIPDQEAKEAPRAGPLQQWAAMLPTREEIAYLTDVAKLMIHGALGTPDLRGSVPRWQANRPLPEKHRVAPDCPCEYCELERRADRAMLANAVTKMLRGRELNMAPLESLEVWQIIKGKMSLKYQKMIDVLAKKGWEIDQEKSIKTETECRLVFLHSTKPPATFSFTMDEAKQAGYATKQNSDGSPNFYQKIPKIMLLARTVSQAYGQLTGAPTYTPEELGDFDDPKPDRLERVEQAAQDPPSPQSQEDKPDERIILPEDESRFRELTRGAGKTQGWANANLAMVTGEMRAARAQDPELTPDQLAEMAKCRLSAIAYAECSKKTEPPSRKPNGPVAPVQASDDEPPLPPEPPGNAITPTPEPPRRRARTAKQRQVEQEAADEAKAAESMGNAMGFKEQANREEDLF